MSYKFGYPYILEFNYDYIEQVLLSSLRAGAGYSSSLTLALGSNNLRFDNFVPRPDSVKISFDGQRGARLVARFHLASGTVTPVIDHFEISASLGGDIVPGRKLHIGAVSGGSIKARSANGTEIAVGTITRSEMENLGLKAKAELDIRLNTREFIMDFTEANVGGRSSGLVVGLFGPTATAPRIPPDAPGTTYPKLPSPEPKVFDTYPGHLSKTARFGLGVDTHMLVIGINYVAAYVARAAFLPFGVKLSIGSIDTKITNLNWPSSFEVTSEIQGSVQSTNAFFPSGAKRIRLAGAGKSRLIKPDKRSLKKFRLETEVLHFQEFDEGKQDWNAPNTLIRGRGNAWVVASDAEFPTNNEPNDIEPVELTKLTGPKDFMFAEGTGRAPVWAAPDGSIVPPNLGVITVRKGETVQFSAQNASAPVGQKRVPLVIFAVDAPTGVTVTNVPSRIEAGKAGSLDVTFTGNGYKKQDLIFFTNDGIFKFSLEVYAEDGKFTTAKTVKVVAKHFRDYTGAGGPIGSERGIAHFDVVWVSGPPVDISVSRSNPVSEFDLIGPTSFRLARSKRQQTFTVHYDAGMRRPWQPLLEEEVSFKSAAPPTITPVRIIGSITRPHIYIPDILMAIIARGYQHGQIKDAILRMERFLKSLKDGPNIPLPPGPGPRPLPPYATDWVIVRAPALPAGNEFAFTTTSGETLTNALDPESVGAMGLIQVRPELEGTFRVGEAPDPEAWLDVLFEFWSARELAHKELAEPAAAIAWHDGMLLVASGNRIVGYSVSRTGTMRWSAEEDLPWSVNGVWQAGGGLLFQNEDQWLYSPVGVGAGLVVVQARPADFPIELAASVSFTQMIVAGEGRLQILTIGDDIETVAEVEAPLPVTNIAVVAPNRAVLIGPDGCAIARVGDPGESEGSFVVEPFYLEPVLRFEIFDRSLLVIGHDGTGRMIDLWAEHPKVVATVNLEALHDEAGIGVEAQWSRDGTGRAAIIASGGHRLEISETVVRPPRTELFDEDVEII